MKKTFKVVMLPTEKASRLMNSSNGRLHYCQSDNVLENNSKAQNQHLYIISDDEIKEGDYYFNPEVKYSNPIFKRNDNGNYSEYRKIIATTDKSLGNTIEFTGAVSSASGFQHLPYIPESFVKAYIKAYNEGNPITEVDLEIESGFTKGNMLKMSEYYYNIKTRSDNTVIIHQSKTYTENEVIKLLDKFGAFCSEDGKNIYSATRWLENNS